MLARYRPKKWQHCVRDKLLMTFIWTSNYNTCCDVTSASLLLLSHFLLCVSLRPAVWQRCDQVTPQAGGNGGRFYSAVSWDATIHHHTFSSQRDPPVGEWRGIHRESQSQQEKEKIGKSSTAVLRNQQLKSNKKNNCIQLLWVSVILYGTFTSFYPLPNSTFVFH